MKRSWLKRGKSQLKRSAFKRRIGARRANLPRRARLRVVGVSTTSELKQEIQGLVRQIVIIRDGGCIFRKEKGHVCTGFAKDGHLILQADHLLPRSNSATFAATRLIVCVCKGIHGWKSVGSNLRKAQYDERIKKLLPKETVELWKRCEQDRWRPTRMTAYDWKATIVALKQELSTLTSLSE